MQNFETLADLQIQQIDSPLMLAKFDRSLNCTALSQHWLLPDNLSIEAGKKLQLHQLILNADNSLIEACNIDWWQQNAQAHPVLLPLQQQEAECFLYSYNEQGALGEQQLSIIILQYPCEQLSSELFELRRQYELILGSAGEGIYGLDKNGKATFSNDAATRILGWRHEDILGIPLHDIHHHSHEDLSPYPQCDCPIYQCLQDGQIRYVDHEVFWCADGSSIPVEYTATPIVDNQGEIQGAVVVFRDVSERKALEASQQKAFAEIKQLKEELEQERDYLRNEINVTTNFGEIIGSSPALQRSLAQISAVADTPTSVLVLGESGVGKEMIARALHNQSSRKDAPLVKVNCASIPKELFESEFFGHIKGSFTGAHRDRIGRLQLANGGTLFLDEVGEIPLDLQGKLLRALQEQEFERVGDEQTQKVDVRVVAATNRDLQEEVAAGNFREDLYYRLSVFPISVPALRERASDIPLLAQHFLNLSCKELGREALHISQQQLQALSQHNWPGNIRELKNVVERAVILSPGKRLRLELAMPESLSLNQQQDQQQAVEDELDFLTDEQMREFEKQNMQKALAAANGKIAGKTGAAALLGLKPSTLTYRMGLAGLK